MSGVKSVLTAVREVLRRELPGPAVREVLRRELPGRGGSPSARDDGKRPLVEGVRLDSVTEAEAVEHIVSALKAGTGGVVVTPNVSIIRAAQDPAVGSLLRSASLSVCDGWPVRWASALQGCPLPERVTGSSLIWSLSHAAALNCQSVFLLGGPPGAADAAAERLREECAGLVVAGTACPALGFEHRSNEFQRLADALAKARPAIVFVGLGFPKQEKVSFQLAERLPGTWFINCGAAVVFAAGQQKRAPWWMQRWGLEWLHRLLMEPKRLGPRYGKDMVFAAGMLTRALLRRQRAGRRK